LTIDSKACLKLAKKKAQKLAGVVQGFIDAIFHDSSLGQAKVTETCQYLCPHFIISSPVKTYFLKKNLLIFFIPNVPFVNMPYVVVSILYIFLNFLLIVFVVHFS
jgi:hypothetical protein